MKRILQVDEATGEAVNVFASVVRHKHPYRAEGFIQMSQLQLMSLAQKPVSPTAFRVLMALAALTDYENWISINQAEIARQLCLAAPNLSRAISELLKRQIIVRAPGHGHHRAYRFSPTWGFKGCSKGFQRVMEEFNEAAKVANTKK